MSTTAKLIEGKNGEDDTVEIVKDGVSTIFDSIDDAASHIGVETEWLEEKLDEEGYDSILDVDAAEEEDLANEEDESDDGDEAA